ncbi:MAG: dihydroxy-acid dehydratase [Candidatus Gracilibacteria bacterium]|nr:dihydroxy-acid dehydratase [Candidatus Gracilibacteria bacterium]
MNLKSNILKTLNETTPHRSLLRATGLKDEDFSAEKPYIGVANSYNNIIAGHTHLNILTAQVMKGIRDAGGVPFVWGVPGVCDGLAMFAEMRLSLPSRDHIADNIEIMMLSHSFDGWVGVTNCDKITPGMLMAAGRLNLPAIMITGGAMEPGKNYEEKSGDLISAFEAVGAYNAGKIDEEKLHKVECEACPTAGSCAGLFTANSMACVTECLGMSLTDCATTLATDPKKLKQAYETGREIVELVKKNIRPRDIMTLEAFEDAMTLDNAIGGSTNVTLHLPEIAREAGVKINLKDFDNISRTTPNICHLSPAGPYYIADIDKAGGMKQVMKNLEEKLHLDRISVNGNLREIISKLEKVDNNIIRSSDNPYYFEGGVSCLVGNICEESVVKQTSVNTDMLKHSGPAKVFYSEQDVIDGVKNKKIEEGDIVVLPFQGPAGAPGMPEMLTPTSAIKGAGFKNVALITDGRFSGGTAGPCIGHITPEAYNGGKIGLIKNGDTIEIDIPNRILNVKVTEEEFENRRKNKDFIVPERIMTPLLLKFRKNYSK